MAQYTCSVWSNSGFNSINIPDSPALLMNMLHVDYPVIELNQERVLPTVRIRALWNNIKDADYCKVGDFYYAVDDVYMTSGDVAVLTLTPDYVTSAGGPAVLNFLDGITERVHVSDDTFGLYGADDPYMAPSLDMDVQTVVKSFAANGSYTFIETTLDLSKIYTNINADTVKAITCKDPNNLDPDGNEYYVTVPSVDYSENTTTYYCGVGGISTQLAGTHNQCLYELDDTANSDPYRKAIAHAWVLGLGEALSGQFEIPKDMLVSGSGNVGAPGRKTSLRGHVGNYAAAIAFKYGKANNNRVFYGGQTPYYLTAASGSTMKANAEEIYSSGLTYPYVSMAVDPRRMGKPYYRFRYLNGIDGDASLDFFRGCVAGKEWLNHPLVFTDKGGSILDQMNFDASMLKMDLSYRQAGENKALADALGGIGGVGSMVGDIATRGGEGFVSAFGTALQTGYNEGMRGVQYKQYQQKILLDKAIETEQFMVSQNVYVPDVRFPVSPDLFSEATGNGYMVNRVVYKAADIARIDKILTAYGYRHSKMLEATDFTNRTYFNYVKASVSVGNLPGWFANGIAAQLSNGVRVWHVQPSPTYYASNPVVTPTV